MSKQISVLLRIATLAIAGFLLYSAGYFFGRSDTLKKDTLNFVALIFEMQLTSSGGYSGVDTPHQQIIEKLRVSDTRYGRLSSYRISRSQVGFWGLPVSITAETVRGDRKFRESITRHSTRSFGVYEIEAVTK